MLTRTRTSLIVLLIELVVRAPSLKFRNFQLLCSRTPSYLFFLPAASTLSKVQHQIPKALIAGLSILVLPTITYFSSFTNTFYLPLGGGHNTKLKML